MNKVKALFPENVEKIIITKNDYDRLTGDLTLENIELKQEIERLTFESTKWESKFYDEAKKVDKAIEYIEKNVWSCYILDDEKELIETDSEELLEILKGVDKE